MKELKELEKEYINLVNKAESVLEEIHKRMDEFPPEAINKLRILLNKKARVTKEKINELEETEQVEDKRLNSLTKIKGVGEETVRDIKNIYTNYDDLVRDIKSKKVIPLRNDIVKKIKKHINKQEV